MIKKLESKKCELVEKLGIHIEEMDNFAPLAARIVAFVILNGRQGTTFEQLVNNLCASKSTISTHLTQLQNLKKLSYFTKTGDRKKYFVVNRDRILQSIDEMIATWNIQKELHVEIKEYKDSFNKLIESEEELYFDLGFHTDYITFLDEATTSISVLRQKLLEKLCPEGVEFVKLKTVVKSIKTGLNPRKNFKLNDDNSKNYYVTVKEFTSGKIKFSNKTFIVVFPFF